MPRPLRIGLSARIMYPDAQRGLLPGKTLHYAESSVQRWLMSDSAIVFVIPAFAPTEYPALAAKFIEELDGLVLQGGSDVAPATYGATPLRPEWAGDPQRDAYELALLGACLAQEKPVLGICRGCQLINVALGGTLYQDLATQVGPGSAHHRNEQHYDQNRHRAEIIRNTHLAEICGTAGIIEINSIHHQAIDRLGTGLRVEARSIPDGIIEAVEGLGVTYVRGLQWHPEFSEPTSLAAAISSRLLRHFLAACDAARSLPFLYFPPPG